MELFQNFIAINYKKSADAATKTVQQFSSGECFYNAVSVGRLHGIKW
jgi:hypothetical protein